MKAMSIDRLRPGMILARNVATTAGRQLFPRGRELNGDEQRIFRIWGVKEVYVADGQPVHFTEQPEAEGDQALRNAAEQLAETVFVESRSSEEHTVLRRIFIENVSKTMQEQGIETVLHNYRHNTSDNLTGQRKGNDPPPTKEALLQRELKLEALPSSVTDLLEAINNHYSASAIAGVIGKDLGLSAKLIQLVNSAFYGFPQQIDTLSRAVAIIGQQQLLTLVISISVIDTFKNIKGIPITTKDFWEHSLSCGIICKCLAEQAGLADIERSFLTGLLHDIGRLIVIKQNPQMYMAAVELADHEHCSLHRAEKQLWGYDHAELGADLLTTWNLPTVLCDTIRYHHAPRQGEMKDALLHLADATCHAATMGSSGMRRVPGIDRNVWQNHAISPDVLEGLIDDARSQSTSLLNLLL